MTSQVLSLCAAEQINNKNNNRHAAQHDTSVKCCVSALRAMGEKEPLMHLIRAATLITIVALPEDAYRAASAQVGQITDY